MHTETIHLYFPNIKWLKGFALFALFISYFALVLINTVCFRFIILPLEGNITSSYVFNATEDDKVKFTLVCVSEFLLPVCFSCLIYLLLLYNKIVLRKLKVDIKVLETLNNRDDKCDCDGKINEFHNKSFTRAPLDNDEPEIKVFSQLEDDVPSANTEHDQNLGCVLTREDSKGTIHK